jgi:TonB family protein
MRNTTVSLFAFFLILTVTPLAFAQDTKPAEQKPATVVVTDTEKPRNEVEKLIAEASKRGEKVLRRCIDPSVCSDELDQVLNLERGRTVHLSLPAYPPIARAAHAEGSVEVQVIIDEAGEVIAAAAISGHPLLQAACVKAARQSEFTPTKLDGVPVKVTGVLRYNFVTQ